MVIVKPPLNIGLDVTGIQAIIEPTLKNIIEHFKSLNPSCDSTSTIMAISGGENYEIILENYTTIITECDDDLGRVRRLYFKSNANVIQSESFKPTSSTFDYNKLSFKYHYTMIASLYLAPEIVDKEICVIGLGGGQLSMYLSTNFENQITTVELDEEVKGLAVEYFGFKEGKKNKVVIGDGLEGKASVSSALKSPRLSQLRDIYGRNSSAHLLKRVASVLWLIRRHYHPAT